MKILSIFLLSLNLISTSACLPEKNQEEGTTEAVSAISISDAYAFETMPGDSTAAAFMKIQNIGDEDDTLISARAKISSITEIHENMIDPDDGTMMMRKIKSLSAPVEETVILEPKGYHIMFIKLRDSLTIGSSFPLTLNFEKAGQQDVNVKVIAPGATYTGDE
jgi:hypothetical protein